MKEKIRAWVLSGTVFLAAVALMVAASLWIEQYHAAYSAEQTKTIVRNACVTCFAVEGRYPDTLAYLEENYGVSIDETRYIVTLDSFADNVFPQISVLTRGQDP